MRLVVESARFKLLMICLLVQPLRSTAADQPEDNSRGAVLVTTSGAAESAESSSVEPGYHRNASADFHPLQPLLTLAREAAARIATDVEDYTCTLVKRERVGGRLLPSETIFAKVRHLKAGEEEEADRGCRAQLYLRFESPSHLSGREILFPCPESDEHLLVRNGGSRLAFVTLQLTPTCALAMRGNRYPITEFGIERLVQRMIELGEKELIYDECEVSIREGAEVDGRTCSLIEVLHPVPREHFIYHIARIYVDDELQLPIRFEAFDWPDEKDGDPELIEDYTYRNLQINVGLSGDDFRRDHPAYKFSRR